ACAALPPSRAEPPWGTAPRIPDRLDGGPRHRLHGASPARVDGAEPWPMRIVEEQRHAVGGEYRDGLSRRVGENRVGVADEPARARPDHRRAVHLLEERGGTPRETVRLEQRTRALAQRWLRIAKRGDAREVTRGEGGRHAG